MTGNETKARISPETRAEAARIARATQRPGQTKEQTRLIEQGIRKGIDQYKKQHKAKARQVDRQKKRGHVEAHSDTVADNPPASNRQPAYRSLWLPWLLLAASWLGFAVYLAGR